MKLSPYLALNLALVMALQPLIAEAQTPDSVDLPEQIFSVETTTGLQVLSVGLNLGDRNVNAGTLVLGKEDGQQATDFSEWRIAYNDLIDALNIKVTTLDDGQLELRSPGSVVRLDPAQLLIDPQLGMVFTPTQIEELLGVPVDFDIAEYALVFDPPWLGKSYIQANNVIARQPVNLEGLPYAEAPNASLSAISQEMRATGGGATETDYSGEFTAVGSILGGSWYANIDQNDLDNSYTWELDELQYLKQSPDFDVAIGSQPSFWPEGNGEYFGVTAIQRFGFTPPVTSTTLGSGFNPDQRLSSSVVRREIRGETEPGTLVRLVSTLGNRVVAEMLVDSSGVYRFDDIPAVSSSYNGGTLANNFRLLLYPDGQLTLNPEIRDVTYASLPGQLTAGTSALISSIGMNRRLNTNRFFGDFDEQFSGAIAYRWGATESLTFGTGLIYDDQLKGLGEIFFQPANIPLRVTAEAVINSDQDGDSDGDISYNAHASYNPTDNLALNFSSDELSQRARANWRIAPGFSTSVSWDSREDALAGGVNLSGSAGEALISTSLNIDTNQNLRWNLYSRYRNLSLRHQGNEISTNTDLEYYFFDQDSPFFRYDHSLYLGYDTTNNNNEDDQLLTAGWRYQSPNVSGDRFADLVVDIGYGIGSQGSGLIASIGTNLIPGLGISARYQDVSLTDDESSFSVLLSSQAFLQPQLSFGNSYIDELRGEGGIAILPFIDENENNIQDENELIYTTDMSQEEQDLLLLLNNQEVEHFSDFGGDLRDEGIFLRLAPDVYRLDIDTAGIPIGWKTEGTSAYAVEVNAGSYTPIKIPLTQAFTLLGVVSDAEGAPVRGVRVEAIPRGDRGSRALSVTNGAGIYYLESLGKGEYDLFVNGQLAEPGRVEITGDLEVLTELNLNYPADTTNILSQQPGRSPTTQTENIQPENSEIQPEAIPIPVPVPALTSQAVGLGTISVGNGASREVIAEDFVELEGDMVLAFTLPYNAETVAQQETAPSITPYSIAAKELETQDLGVLSVATEQPVATPAVTEPTVTEETVAGEQEVLSFDIPLDPVEETTAAIPSDPSETPPVVAIQDNLETVSNPEDETADAVEDDIVSLQTAPTITQPESPSTISLGNSEIGDRHLGALSVPSSTVNTAPHHTEDELVLTLTMPIDEATTTASAERVSHSNPVETTRRIESDTEAVPSLN